MANPLLTGKNILIMRSKMKSLTRLLFSFALCFDFLWMSVNKLYTNNINKGFSYYT